MYRERQNGTGSSLKSMFENLDPILRKGMGPCRLGRLTISRVRLAEQATELDIAS